MAAPSGTINTSIGDVTTTTATNAGTTAVRLGPIGAGLQFMLNVTAAATDAIDTLDIWVQTLLDGSNWVDVIHFTQVVGNASVPLRTIGKIIKAEPTTMFSVATALTAGNVRHLFGETWRLRWDVVDADANASWTFTVAAISTEYHIRSIP